MKSWKKLCKTDEMLVQLGHKYQRLLVLEALREKCLCKAHICCLPTKLPIAVKQRRKLLDIFDGGLANDYRHGDLLSWDNVWIKSRRNAAA